MPRAFLVKNNKSNSRRQPTTEQSVAGGSSRSDYRKGRCSVLSPQRIECQPVDVHDSESKLGRFLADGLGPRESVIYRPFFEKNPADVPAEPASIRSSFDAVDSASSSGFVDFSSLPQPLDVRQQLTFQQTRIDGVQTGWLAKTAFCQREGQVDALTSSARRIWSPFLDVSSSGKSNVAVTN